MCIRDRASTARANASPSGRARPERPSSLCPSSTSRTTPPYAATAHVGGNPGGGGEGATRRAGPDSAVEHWAHSTEPGATHAVQAIGKTRSVSYTHLRAHETGRNLVCRLLLEK